MIAGKGYGSSQPSGSALQMLGLCFPPPAQSSVPSPPQGDVRAQRAAKTQTSAMGDAPLLCLWVGIANSCMDSTGRHRASVIALQLLGLKNRQLLIA